MSNDKSDEQTSVEDSLKLYQVGPVGSTAYKFEALIKDPDTCAVIRAIISEGVAEGVKAHCRVPISSKEAQQVRFVFDSLKLLGDGDIHVGIDVAVENHKAVKEYRGWIHDTSVKVGRWVIIGILSTLAGLTVLGIKVVLNRTP